MMPGAQPAVTQHDIANHVVLASMTLIMQCLHSGVRMQWNGGTWGHRCQSWAGMQSPAILDA